MTNFWRYCTAVYSRKVQVTFLTPCTMCASDEVGVIGGTSHWETEVALASGLGFGLINIVTHQAAESDYYT